MKFLVVLCAFVLGSSVAHAKKVAPAPDPEDKTVVLVHGAFADGSSWNDVIPLLQSKGLKVVAVQNPLTSLAADVAATKRVIDGQSGRVILVGHSWGGVVITEAGNNPKVAAMVYVAAFAPDDGQSALELVNKFETPVGFKKIKADPFGFLYLSEDGMINDFAQDLPESRTKVMAVTQGPIGVQTFNEKITTAAWKTKPTWYVVATDDHMIHPDLQNDVSTKMHAKVKRLRTSHVPMNSKPKEVAKVILEAADSLK
ncbi:alpha/beta fold hydrolase [Bdellovibrio sp. HCB337]|uniref:alpha/beta fold hydrolase n=1 Tax=Bdellovibrio sp. HCB337 TaxID=3394358 RepID=UPI0039A6650A